MRSFATLSAFAVPALALSYSHGNPMHKRHHELAERQLQQRDSHVVAPSAGRMARKLKRGDASTLSPRSSKSETYTTTAIWYAEAGWIGSCGELFNDDDMVIGLPLELYPNPAEKSDLCGQSVVVVNSKTGKQITAVVKDASQRDAYTTFTKGAYQALGGDLDVGELSVSYYFANPDSIASSLPSAFSTSATDKEKSAVKTSASSAAPQTSAGPVEASSSSASSSSSSQKAYEGSKGAVHAAAATTTVAPSTTVAPTTPAYDSSSAAHASSVSAKAAADAAWASSSSAEADKLWASSSSAAAAAASSKAAAEWAASSSSSAAAAAASSKAAAEEAAASSKAAADAAWASSSSAAAAAAATSAASSSGSSSGSGHVYSGGIATFFYQNGVAGNCGQVNSDSTLLVALPTATYDNGAHCGKYVTITRSDTGNSIRALVADSCPTCNNNSCLDLSWGAFSALGGTQNMGVFDITWQFD
ncbi:hypothetical protein JCM10212_004093 [Sporobolomyces blumeae]